MTQTNTDNLRTVYERPLVVFGSEGFIGKHLVALQTAHGPAVGIDHARGQQADSIANRLRRIPQSPVVIHAAGSVSKTGLPNQETYLKSTIDLFQAVAAVQPSATVVTLGSVIEQLDTRTPYALIKRQQRALACQAAEKLGIHWIHMLLHNPVGPGQAQTQVAGAIARRLLMTISQSQPLLRIRHSGAVRDWMDVRDVCRVILAVTEKCKPTNRHPIDRQQQVEVCTGNGQSVWALANALVSASGADIMLVDDAATPTQHTAASDTRTVVGDPTNLRQLIGSAAAPRHSLTRSMRDLWHTLLVTEGPRV